MIIFTYHCTVLNPESEMTKLKKCRSCKNIFKKSVCLLFQTVPTLIGQLYCLAANPDKQERLYQEVCDVVPEGQPITPDVLNKLSYLKACVKEGFR